MLNITTFLDANSKRLDKKVLYNPTTGNKYNSGEILSIVSEIGRELKNLGINKGDRVLIYLNNSEEYLFSLFLNILIYLSTLSLYLLSLPLYFKINSSPVFCIS